MVTKELRGGECIQHGDIGQRNYSQPGGMEWDGGRFHHATQKGTQT